MTLVWILVGLLALPALALAAVLLYCLILGIRGLVGGYVLLRGAPK